ncbi:MAG TPA: matrixin family metalloprotease [Allosphingosinicella sp.]|jgi:Ca2+-binding RTX toxin-like protein
MRDQFEPWGRTARIEGEAFARAEANEATVSDYTALISGSSLHGRSGIGAFCSFSFPTSVPDYYEGVYPEEGLASFRPMTQAEKAVAREAIAAWGEACGLTFFEVAPGDGDIKFMSFDLALVTPDQFDAAFAYLPGGQYGDGGFQSDVFLDFRWADDLHIQLHEIGHAIGLKHPFEGSPTLDPDRDHYGETVMSYSSDGFPGDVLGPLDRDAVQFLYGDADADGGQAASWSWDPAARRLSQTGSETADILLGIGGRDSIDGRGGDDFLNGREGADRLAGGAGRDELSGGWGDDVLDGGDHADQLYGGWDADALSGGLGADLLNGGVGDDLLAGGEGADTYQGHDGFDTVSYQGEARGVTVALNQGRYIEALQRWENMSEVEALIGSSFADALTGDGGANRLDGGSGADRLEGGGGDDRLDGGAGLDTASFRSAAAGVRASLAVAGAQDTLAGLDTLLGVERLEGSAFADALTGNAGANLLSGLDGADRLAGGAGADRLAGGAGRDFALGGAGADQFLFANGDFGGAVARSADRIAGFEAAADRINLRAVDAVAGGADDRFTFVGEAAFSGTAGELRWHHANGATLVSGDVDGDGKADFMIRLDGAIALTAAEFVV